MQQAAKKQTVQFPQVVFEMPQFQVSAFGFAHRVISAMRKAGIAEEHIEQYKQSVSGLDLDQTMLATMYVVTVV